MRTIALGFFVSVSSLVLAGCGSTADPAAGGETTTTPTTTDAGPSTPSREAAAEAVLDSFTCPSGVGTLVDGMNVNFTAGGRKRAFHLSLPKSAGTKPIAVIFSWHGVGDNVDNFRQFFGPDPDSRADFPMAVVTPSCVGCSQSGQDVGLLPTTTPKGITWDIFESKPGDGNLEAALFEGVLGCLNKQINIDPKHVHSVGFSGGAIASGMLHARYAKLVHSVVQLSGAWFDDSQTVGGVKANLDAAAPAAANFGVDLSSIKLEWNLLDSTDSGAVLASHGGATDQYAVAGFKVIDFELSFGFAKPFLKANTRGVIDCPHTGGHQPPRYIGELHIVDFLRANPLPETTTAVSMPASLGTNCTVAN